MVRSIAIPMSAIVANTITSESGAGTPRSTSDTYVSAANRRSGPWAKLSTPDVL